MQRTEKERLTDEDGMQQDLFATSIGPLRRVAMSYKANGQSTGQCTVEFQRGDDANRAYAQYNNRLIDGSAYRK